MALLKYIWSKFTPASEIEMTEVSEEICRAHGGLSKLTGRLRS